MYSATQMLAASVLAAVGIAAIVIAAFWGRSALARRKGYGDGQADYEHACVEDGCRHTHALEYQDDRLRPRTDVEAGLITYRQAALSADQGLDWNEPGACPFRCDMNCYAGEYHCANLHVAYHQRDHEPEACPAREQFASLNAMIFPPRPVQSDDNTLPAGQDWLTREMRR